MYLLRSTWRLRLIAIFTMVSLLPLAVLPTAEAARYTATYFYSGWLRAQLEKPVDLAFETALKKAATTQPRSFDEFLTEFIKAYEAQSPALRLADIFASPELSKEALVHQLSGRFHSLSGEAIPSHVSLVAAQSPHSITSGSRATNGNSATLLKPFFIRPGNVVLSRVEEMDLPVVSILERWSCLPQGP